LKPARPSSKTLQVSASAPALTKAGAGQLRIIGGHWRGRKLSFPDVEGLRPTGDRIRETLFNWLAPEIQGARCLDVFAGSGALGIEALSRGAGVSLLVERDNKAASSLKSNLELVKAENGRVICTDALSWLQKGNEEAPFQIIFIDPPFQLNLWQAVIDALEAGNWLANDATIYIESNRDAAFLPPINWQLHRDKHTGAVSYRLYYRESSLA
jgi:16S rRNA (guanine966-N2)-methyltransferase